MKKKYQFSFIVILLLQGCIKEKQTLSDTIFLNNTNHFISVIAFQNGNPDPENSFTLNANEIKNVFTFRNRGKGVGMTFGGINHPKDSFLVVFNGQDTIVHYKPTLVGTSFKRYLYESRRNLYNDSSYDAVIKSESKYSREWEFKYSFVEQDYIDAQ